MKLIRSGLLLAVIVSGYGLSLQAAEPVREHPRLMFRTAKWTGALSPSEAAARVKREPYQSWYNRLDAREFQTGALSWLIRSQLGQAGSPRDAVADSVIARMLALPEREGNFFYGENLHRMSLAYDWLYNYPGFTAEAKKKLRVRMFDMAHHLITRGAKGEEIVYGEEIFHNYCSNAALAIGLTGLALWEGPQDTASTHLIRVAEDWYFNRSFKAMELLGGGWHEGMAYSLNHVLQETPIWVAAYRTATGEDWFARIKREQGDWMEGWIYFCLAALRPDWTFMRSGDANFSRMLPDRTLRQALELIVSAYGNGHGQSLLNELEERLGERSLSNGDLWMPLLFYSDSLEARSWRELPPSQVINPEHLGLAVLRSGWGEADTYITFEAGDYFGSHNHLDQNSFTIYHRGGLALDSGGYDGYGEQHEMYAVRSLAHNTVLVRDPQELTYSHYHDPFRSSGGQRSLDYYFSNSNYDISLYWDQYRDKAWADAADMTAWQNEPDFDYVAGDATAAYNSTRVTEPGARPKISRFTRRLLFVKPDIIAVCDNVDAVCEAFEKHWLLHTAEEPQILGDYTVVTEAGQGGLTLQALLPEDVFVTKTGGPGKEFLVDRVNRPLRENETQPPAEPGAWRLDLTISDPRKQDIYLVMMQTGERGVAAPRFFSLIQNEDFVGAAAEDVSLLFTRDRETGAPLPERLSLPKGIAQGSRVYLAGLVPDGIYRVRAGQTERGVFSVGQGGVLRLNLGQYNGLSLTLEPGATPRH